MHYQNDTIYLNGHSYLIFRNLTLEATGGPLAVRAKNVSYCEFDALTCTTAVMNSMQFRLYDSSTFNWIHDCELANQGTGTTGGRAIDIGTQQANTDGGGGSGFLSDRYRQDGTGGEPIAAAIL